MSARNAKASNEAQVRQLITDWVKALQAKDIDELVAHYERGIVLFGIAPPLSYKGADAYRKNVEGWVLSFQGPLNYEITDLSITASDDLAFSHSINRLTGTRKDGEKTDSWMRVTVCFEKVEGEWMVKHEHVSVPFHMDTGKAAIDLKP